MVFWYSPLLFGPTMHLYRLCQKILGYCAVGLTYPRCHCNTARLCYIWYKTTY